MKRYVGLFLLVVALLFGMAVSSEAANIPPVSVSYYHKLHTEASSMYDLSVGLVTAELVVGPKVTQFAQVYGRLPIKNDLVDGLSAQVGVATYGKPNSSNVFRPVVGLVYEKGQFSAGVAYDFSKYVHYRAGFDIPVGNSVSVGFGYRDVGTWSGAYAGVTLKVF